MSPPPASALTVLPQAARRAVECAVWLFRSFSSNMAKRVFGAMMLEFCGTVLQAAGILLAVRFGSIYAKMPHTDRAGEDSILIIGIGVAIFLLVAVGGGCNYLAQRITIKLSTDFENVQYASALKLIKRRRAEGRDVSLALEKEILMQSPRFMGRMLLQLVRAIPAGVIGITVFVLSFFLNFWLSVSILSVLVMLAPFFILLAIYSSRTGRWMKDSSPGFAKSKNQMSKTWMEKDEPDVEEMLCALNKQTEYNEFFKAYQARLQLPPQIQFLGSVTLSFALLIVFLWFMLGEAANANELPSLLIYLVFMRLFFAGMIGISAAVSTSGSFYPFFSNYITLESGGNAQLREAGAKAGDDVFENEI